MWRILIKKLLLFTKSVLWCFDITTQDEVEKQMMSEEVVGSCIEGAGAPHSPFLIH